MAEISNDNREFFDLLGNGTYRICEQLGSGSFGQIVGGFNISTSERVALKVIETTGSNAVYSREAYFSTLLRNHPNVIQTTKAYTVNHKRSNKKYGILVLERMEEDLMDYLLKRSSLTEKETRIIFTEICKSIEFCHSRCVAHLDIKPDNILLRRHRNAAGDECHSPNGFPKFDVKLCDFGFALEWKSEQVVEGKFVKFGSENYRAPEAAGSHWQNFQPDKADIWSLGVTLFIMITGFYPFYRLKNSWVSEDLSVLNTYCKNSLCCDLVTSMLQLDPYDRPSIQEVLNHPWFHCQL